MWIGVALTSAQGPAPLTPTDLRALASSRTGSLKNVSVVDAPTFDQYVRDRGALLALGKALFWDQQLGSDRQACASCHFHAGADSRSKHQLNPGSKAVPPRSVFTAPTHANQQLLETDFPFHTGTRDNNAIVSSSGVIIAADGAFKTPGLRNAELTAPYFHNGGISTLEDVVRFYNHGGDFADVNRHNLDADITALGLNEQDILDVAEFLRALTDTRVRHESAPFDHPSLNIGNGGTPGIFTNLLGVPVLDDRLCIPAVGADGNQQPLGTPNSPSANFLQPIAGACQ